MPCLDTDILIGIARNDADAVRKVELLYDKNLSLSTTIVNAYELFKGAYLSERASRNTEHVRQILDTLKILPVGVRETEVAGKLHSLLVRKGKPIGELDTLISAVALANNEVVVTRNIKHFKQVPGLKVETW